MKSMDIITLRDPKSPVSEAYRILRTNIQFSSPDKKLKTILITSSGPSEGKTTTSVNLAVTMSQFGSRTLLIDCDQRKPRIHKILSISNQVGLSNVLIGEAAVEEALVNSGIENLDILPAGTRPPNPSELLASEKMGKFIDSLREKYDYIILDTPPAIMVTDAQILSKYADGCILVVASGQADREAALRAKELLEKVNAKILGVILNKIEATGRSYYGYYYGEKEHRVKRKTK